MIQEKISKRIGWLASLMAIIMFASYIDQIRMNLAGQPGSLLLPIATTINCLCWICYAMLQQQKDWPVFSCNLLGMIISMVTTVTALM